MATQFRLPGFGHTMEKGRVVEWHVEEGTQIAEGELLVSIETDKTVVEVESPIGGVLLRIVAQPDGEYEVGHTLAWIGEAGEEIPEARIVPDQIAAPDRSSQSLATPIALRLAKRHGIDTTTLQGTGPSGRITKEDVQRAVTACEETHSAPTDKTMISEITEKPTTQSTESSAKSRATPVALRLAERHGIDVTTLHGSGPGTRVTKEDVRRAIDNTTTAKETPAGAAADKGVKIASLTGIRRTTAERLQAMWEETPLVTEGIDVDFTNLQKIRKSNSNAWLDSHGIVPTINDFVLKATAKTLRCHPQLNTALIDGAIHHYQQINLGVAIDIDAGLVVPVLRNADALGIIALAKKVQTLAENARSGTLRINDFEGGTFTVTNLGGLGIDWFTPILNPPQSAILGVGRVRPIPAVQGASIVPRDMATLVVTFDHRVLDGAPCARFLRDLRVLIEEPPPLLP